MIIVDNQQICFMATNEMTNIGFEIISFSKQYPGLVINFLMLALSK